MVSRFWLFGFGCAGGVESVGRLGNAIKRFGLIRGGRRVFRLRLFCWW